MSLTLGNRQLAMLREMGVRVWQPARPGKVAADADAGVGAGAGAGAAAAPAHRLSTPATGAFNEISSAINTGAARASIQSDIGAFDANKPASNNTSAPLPRAALIETAQSESAWQIGELQTLYPPSAALTNVPRWLVLLEAPASALQSPFNAFEGDAGKLLDNMLRATGMHTAGAVQLAPLVRGGNHSGAARSGSSINLPGQLAQLLASSLADVVLVMGRLAAQALLQSAEPLPKLRGRVHDLKGGPNTFKTIVTLDPTYLLRNPLDKAKAWDDLCLALSIVGVQRE